MSVLAICHLKSGISYHLVGLDRVDVAVGNVGDIDTLSKRPHCTAT